ncbi:MAG: hypothetical protein IPJ03_17355 [Ignavibacteriales bacterium]|nr:hypothetical protein [Ignavibacteriales bacterium]
MNLMDNYNKALDRLYKHVGFKEDWVVYPINDCTDKFWNVEGDTVKYANTKEEFESESGEYFEDELYKQRFYDKWIYEGKQLTLIFCNTHIDGVCWFRIFDNDKKC